MPPTTPQNLKRLITLTWVINILTAVCLIAVGLVTYSPKVRADNSGAVPTVTSFQPNLDDSGDSGSPEVITAAQPAAVLVSPSQTPSALPTHTSTPLPTATFTPTFTPTNTPTPKALTFAVIGDWRPRPGNDEFSADVPALIYGWEPEIIITLGDNNYPDGSAETIDANIGQYFHEYIYPYTGSYGPGAEVNRFFPILGNHDWNATAGAQAYLDYFSLPGNERYYDFTWGPVHFFALDSCLGEPDGVKADSVQAAWLQQGLAASTSPWNIVLSHYPAYSSGYHGSTSWIQWPFAAWGADAVMNGHDHNYERVLVDGIPYFTNGLGGSTRYFLKPDPLRQTQFRYNDDYGAMRVTATETEMLFEFYTWRGELIDAYQVTKP